MNDDCDDYFGLCPHCGKSDGYINIGRSHWFFCREHKVKWLVGSNLFSGWREETEDQQRARYDEVGLGAFQNINPYHPKAKHHGEDLPF